MLRGRRRHFAAGLGEAISGCIMFEETLYQDAADGKPFVDVLKAQGILPGIKVDTGELYCPLVSWISTAVLAICRRRIRFLALWQIISIHMHKPSQPT